jgi:hypothetical protein
MTYYDSMINYYLLLGKSAEDDMGSPPRNIPVFDTLFDWD